MFHAESVFRMGLQAVQKKSYLHIIYTFHWPVKQSYFGCGIFHDYSIYSLICDTCDEVGIGRRIIFADFIFCMHDPGSWARVSVFRSNKPLFTSVWSSETTCKPSTLAIHVYGSISIPRCLKIGYTYKSTGWSCLTKLKWWSFAGISPVLKHTQKWYPMISPSVPNIHIKCLL